MIGMDEYVVMVNGIEHTMLLDEADAKRLGLKALRVANKQAAPANKAVEATVREAEHVPDGNRRPAGSRRK